ncbi:predicted protein [Sclerotinia sclerotiorum 1980 UF-70]|uniref:Uncharacterized protein n=1 Tax=Sclerotinia sclerotiorum (strain ATCC 18683 / 1980 / Ss-1) TaxID=665079 RepID=A7E9V2_SCLS1|nr:predicted protein [Sclerotinia sclerotiorum 1980 UF-70]EDN97154.1 predicted protein [Sclerotinia sclerotiorum 1980 UF-70]
MGSEVLADRDGGGDENDRDDKGDQGDHKDGNGAEEEEKEVLGDDKDHKDHEVEEVEEVKPASPMTAEQKIMSPKIPDRTYQLATAKDVYFIFAILDSMKAVLSEKSTKPGAFHNAGKTKPSKFTQNRGQGYTMPRKDDDSVLRDLFAMHVVCG